MAVEIITSFQQICDANGDPLSGAKINVYAVNTTTPLSLFSDTGLSIGAANPIVTDSAGRHDMRYVATGSYKIVITTSADVPVYTRDNIDGRVPVGSGALAIANGGTGATSAGAALTNLGGATAAELADLAADVADLAGALSSSEKTHIATGTTAQRPASPTNGDIRRNTTIPQYEGYNGTSWVKFHTSDDTGTMPTRQVFLSGTAATYTTPALCRQLRIRMVGGGGGGAGGSANNGSAGTASVFNSIEAAPGAGGTANGGDGGAGGSGGAGSASFRIPGQDGSAGNVTAANAMGGPGGSSAFGGGGNGQNTGTGGAAKTNSGGGGQGGVVSNGNGGGGGGAGEYVELIINTPSATYTYTVGALGAAGAAGTQAGGNGAAGIIIVDEFY